MTACTPSTPGRCRLNQWTFPTGHASRRPLPRRPAQVMSEAEALCADSMARTAAKRLERRSKLHQYYSEEHARVYGELAGAAGLEYDRLLRVESVRIFDSPPVELSVAMPAAQQHLAAAALAGRRLAWCAHHPLWHGQSSSAGREHMWGETGEGHRSSCTPAASASRTNHLAPFLWAPHPTPSAWHRVGRAPSHALPPGAHIRCSPQVLPL